LALHGATGVLGLTLGTALGLGLVVGAGLGLSELGDTTFTGRDASTAALASAVIGELCSIAVIPDGSLAGAAIAACNWPTIAPTTLADPALLATVSVGLALRMAALGTAIVKVTSTEAVPTCSARR